MAINTSLLVASPTFQEALVDKTGIPMANGTITCYQDMSRTTLKNWYYQSGTPGNYSYIKLPNPLTLSAAGTVCDINGVDTIPFFYPFSELDQGQSQKYYITIVNETQTNQITRANFPPNSASGGGGGGGGNGLAVNNLVVNGGFWRNLQPNTLNVTPYSSVDLTNQLQMVVSPSQHDGFQYPDVTFFKTNNSATDTLTFTPFPFVPIGSTTSTILINDITPEYYINHACTVAGSNQTQKAYYFPISLHVNTLANVPFTATIQAQNNGSVGAGQNVIKLFIFQDTGQGTAGTLDEIAEFSLNTGWQKYTASSIFPPTTGLTLSNAPNDALYLVVQMPLNLTFDINFTLPSIYLTAEANIPTNYMQTYDQIDAIINSPRTGDIRTSLNSFAPFGWVAANDGTIGTKASLATSRANADTWPLYSTLYVNVSNTYAPVTGGRTAPGNTLAAAYTDFSLNKPLALTKTLGRSLSTAGAGAGLTPRALGQTVGAETAALLIANMPSHNHPGSTVQIGTGVGGIAAAAAGAFLTTDPAAVSVAAQGSGTLNTGPADAFSIMNPSVYYNVFLKL